MSRCVFEARSDYLFRALRNIVENALRYTPEGTTVSIVVADPPAIRVIDRGPGVRPARGTLSFAVSGRAIERPNKGGAGLGMDIAARTVVAHGGVISVEDAPEGGAVFTMQFDISDRPRSTLPFREPTAFRDPFKDCDLLTAVSRL